MPGTAYRIVDEIAEQADANISSPVLHQSLIWDGNFWVNTTLINGLTVDGAPDGANDYVMTYDDSDGTVKKVLLDNLPGGGGGGANTALSNLVSVAINISLVSDTDVTDDLGTGDIRWRDGYLETLNSGLTDTDTLTLRARDVDGGSWQPVLTITSGNTPTANLDSIVTIGGNAILDDTWTGSANIVTVGTLSSGNATAIVDAATDSAAGIVELATISETNTGTDATRAVTPDGLDGWTGSAQVTTVGTLSAGNATAIVDVASVSVTGIVELATVPEAQTGTDDTRAVTPAGLGGWTGTANVVTVGTLTSGNADAIVSAASLTVAGKVELATVAETITGTDATRAVTPAGLAGWTGSGNVTTVGTITTGTWAADLAADTVDAITEIAASIKSGTGGATLITGTAGTSGNLLEWDSNGDAVEASLLANQLMGRYTASTGDVQKFTATDLTEEGAPSGGDFLLGWTSEGNLRKFDVGDLPTGGGGEANTASNGGTGGIGITLTKSGIDLPFKSMFAASSRISVSDGGGNNRVEFDVAAASDTVAGIVELATIAETNTGTSTTLAVTPDGLDGWTGSAQLTTVGTISTGTWSADLAADTVDAIGEIASGLKTGNAGTLVTGTAGTSGNLLEWDASGNAVEASIGTDRLLGRTTASAGDVEELDISTITEEASPASGDWILGMIAEGNLRRFDVGNLPGGGGGANTALSNLAAVAINLSLVSDTDVTDDLGTGEIRWRDVYPETVNSGTTDTDTLKLRGRDIDGGSWVDVLTITSSNTVTANLHSSVTIGGATIMTLAGVQTNSGAKSFNSSTLKLNGSTSGSATLNAPAVASTYVYTLPPGTSTLATLALAETLSNKTWGSGTVIGANFTSTASRTFGLNAASTTVFTINNTNGSNVANVDVDGRLLFRNGTAFTMTMSGTPTAARTITFQDSTYTVVGRDTVDVLTSKTLTAPTINGTVATTGLTLPAFACGNIDLGSSILQFSEANQDIIGSGTGVIYDTPAGDTHDFHIAAASEFQISATEVNIKANTLVGDTASGGDLKLQSTTDATRGNINSIDAHEFEKNAHFGSAQTYTPSGTTQTVDLNENNHFVLVLTSTTGDLTLTWDATASKAQSGFIHVKQHGTTPRNITMAVTGGVTSETEFGSAVKNFSSMSANGRCVISYAFDGTDLQWTATGDNI